MTVGSYQEQLEQLRDAYNARDADAFAAMWNPNCGWHPFLTASVEGDPGYPMNNAPRNYS